MTSNVGDSSSYLHRDESRGCWRRKSRLEKKLIIISIFLFVVTLGLVIGLAVIAGQDKETSEPTYEVCKEEHCVQAAGYLMKSMNLNEDPCNDFHEFVCGQWVKNNPIPEDKGRFGIFDGLRDDLANACIGALKIPEAETKNSAIHNTKAFFESCLKTGSIQSTVGIDQLEQLLNTVNLSTDITKEIPDFHLYRTLSLIVQKYGLNFILSFGVGANVKDTTQNIISLDQPSSFGLGRSFLVNFNETDERIIAYKKYMNDGFMLINSKANADEIKNIVNDILDFEVKMAKLTRSPVERRDASSWYKPMNLSELASRVPQINFTTYINDILEDSSSSVDDSVVVIAKEETYFKKISELIDNEKNGLVPRYLSWRLIQSLGPSLFKELRDIKFQFDKVVLGIQKEKSEDARCFDMTNSYYGQVVGSLYIKATNFDEESKREMGTMVHFLNNAFRKLVKDNDWMDEETKTRATEKLNKMVNFLGYPDWTKDSNKLNEYYQIPSALSQSDFLENYITTMKYSTKRSLDKLKQTNNRKEEWISAASIVNAFYSPSYNSITFPAGILQVPFYGKRLKALNYGAIGYVIGHEITHGFDDSGRQYDGDGSLNDWWTNATLDEFQKRKECFVDQYSAISDPLSGLQLNGSQTIGENIADNGGIRESYQAYLLSGRDDKRLPGLEKYNDFQLYYISAASIWCSQFKKEEMVNQINQGVHSPGMYRAYLPLANDKGFADAFGCKSGSKMNPTDRCVIW